MSEIEELTEFLKLDTRIDVKSLALHQTLCLTGTKEGRDSLLESTKICGNLCLLMNDNQPSVAKDASLALVNLSADEELVPKFLTQHSSVIDVMLNIIMNPEHSLADPACMMLANITRVPFGSEQVFKKMSTGLDKIVDIFCQENFNKKGAKLHYLAAVFSNLSQIHEMRRYLLDQSKTTLQRMVCFTEYSSSIIRRGGIIGMIKNCCFETDKHIWLLSEAVDLLPKLLLPLAGPEEFDEEENEKLPIELQYLGEEKTRESDADLRKMIIEALTQLCSTKSAREYLRSKNAYVILRELHKVEKDNNVLAACEHLVNILIRYEHEIGHDNLKELEVPQELNEKFDAME